ncbi:Rhodanese-like domain-containing protein 6 [Ranunculus cassubicifolius]
MEEEAAGREEGVVLYYKYVDVPNLEDLHAFYHSNCNSLNLRGRVRLAPNGVNVTVGGKLCCLEDHIAAVKSNPLFQGTDFKLQSCDSINHANSQIVKDSGFDSLSIRIVKELVTFSSRPLQKVPVISNAGRHLSAVEFNSILQTARDSLENEGPDRSNKILLLDARNVYETRIGKFQTPKVETFDPKIRQYSDLCTWIDDHSQQLRGTNLLMYCTGGIRCEMASAYIRSKGAGFENVFQLYGGIQRYLEQYPDGGFFKGKNFVFDHRVSVGSSNGEIVGSCLLCDSPFDDYSSRCRCSHCRMLVLVCCNCQTNGATYVCELCQKHAENGDESVGVEESDNLDSVACTTFSPDQGKVPPPMKQPPSRKLRILCLHGFRQNASSFKGRTSSFAKKLKNIAQLVFIDAPHELPFIYHPRPHDAPPLHENCNKKFAWLVSSDYSSSNRKTNWEMADAPFDPLQYKQQIDGYEVSLSYLKGIFSEMGPFDGVLGFSQGAAMTALLCAERERLDGVELKFVILCSGFALNLGSRVEVGSIDCPALHIFGDREGKDRQIGCQDSKELAALFDESCSVTITHESGHIIPTQPPYIDRIKAFLEPFI